MTMPTAKEQGLPELPDGVIHMTDWLDGGAKVTETPYYTAAQMHAYARAAVEQAGGGRDGVRRVYAGLGRIEYAAVPAQSAESVDAARYRWLRANQWDSPIVDLFDGDYENAKGEYLDAAIDAAMTGGEHG
jgi:hypothetical protein